MGDMMKIGIANDHRGIKQKEVLKNYLLEKGYEVSDLGAMDGDQVDYPYFAFLLSEKVVNQELDFGILICGTGVGMSIASNKVIGARCAKVDNEKEAVLAREHNNANLISLSSEFEVKKMQKLVGLFLVTKYSYDDRHNRRLEMITEYEDVC